MAIVLSSFVFVLPNSSFVMASTSDSISVNQVKSFKDTQRFTDKAGNEFFTFTEPGTGRQTTISGDVKDREALKETIKDNFKSDNGKIKLSAYDQSSYDDGYNGAAHGHSYLHSISWSDLTQAHATLNGSQYGEWTDPGVPNSLRLTEDISVSGLNVSFTLPTEGGFGKTSDSSAHYESPTYTGTDFVSSSYTNLKATSYFGLFGATQTDQVIANYNYQDYRAYSTGDITFPL